MKLIDADKLLADITAAEESSGMGHVIASTLKRYITRQPTFIRQSEWISVEDALPPDSADGLSFICMTDIPGRFGGVTPLEWQVACIRGKTVRRWRWMDRICPWRVSHWMLLPKPPEREEDA